MLSLTKGHGTKALFLAALLVITGCSKTSSGTRGGHARGIGTAATTSAANRTMPLDEATGYLHKPSGVGFVFPEGWEHQEVRSEGPAASLVLRKGKGIVEVTLSWAEPTVATDETTIGQLEYDNLRLQYRDKVGRPEPVESAGRHGYRLDITGGPLGVKDPELFGVVYVFAVPRGEQTWKIKVRATVRGQKNLAVVADLLKQYRW